MDVPFNLDDLIELAVCRLVALEHETEGVDTLGINCGLGRRILGPSDGQRHFGLRRATACNRRVDTFPSLLGLVAAVGRAGVAVVAVAVQCAQRLDLTTTRDRVEGAVAVAAAVRCARVAIEAVLYRPHALPSLLRLVTHVNGAEVAVRAITVIGTQRLGVATAGNLRVNAVAGNGVA